MIAMRALILVCALAALAGCATAPSPEVKTAALDPLVCVNKAQCDLYWKRAKIWIVNNSAWRIQQADDVVITTFGPTESSANLAYSVMMEPSSGDSARIRIKAICANAFGCEMHPMAAAAAFKSYVRSGAS
jgi:hypothetical protein